MPTIADGVNRFITYKKQTGQTTADGSSGGQVMRRTDGGSLNLTRSSTTSAEIRQSRMELDTRLQGKTVSGNLPFELVAGDFTDHIQSVLMRDFTAVSSIGPLSDVTATVDGTTAFKGTFTSATADWIVNGFRVGMGLRITGLADSTNNSNNFMITGLSSTVLTGHFVNGTTFVSEASGNPFTFGVPGKVTYIPQTSHTKDFYTIEDREDDVDSSDLYKSVMFTGLDISMPAEGNVTGDVSTLGLDHELLEGAGSPHFVAPAAQGTGLAFSGSNGQVYVGGAQNVVITSMNFSVAGGHSKPNVIGSNVSPDIAQGVTTVGGTFSALIEDSVLRNLFINETETTIIQVLTTSNDNDADMAIFAFPRVQVKTANKDASGEFTTQTFEFSSLEQVASQPTEQTSIFTQDTSI